MAVFGGQPDSPDNKAIRERLEELNNESMSNFCGKMTKYDKLLTEQNNKLLKILSDIETKTAKFVGDKKS